MADQIILGQINADSTEQNTGLSYWGSVVREQ